jgi:hypothetical protein
VASSCIVAIWLRDCAGLLAVLVIRRWKPPAERVAPAPSWGVPHDCAKLSKDPWYSAILLRSQV